MKIGEIMGVYSKRILRQMNLPDLVCVSKDRNVLFASVCVSADRNFQDESYVKRLYSYVFYLVKIFSVKPLQPLCRCLRQIGLWKKIPTTVLAKTSFPD
jgi:hypothetical protein